MDTQIEDYDLEAYGEVTGKLECVGEEDPSFFDEDTSIAQEYAVTETANADLSEKLVSPADCNQRSCITAESRLGMREQENEEESQVAKTMNTFASF